MKWLQFILSHSIFISLCAVALCWQTNLLLQLPDDPFLFGFIFCSTLCSYNFYWLLSKFFFRTGNISLWGFIRREFIQFMVFASAAAGTLYFYIYNSLEPVIVLPAVILTLLYALPLIPSGINRFTKKLGVLKTILLAITWTYVTVWIPIRFSETVMPEAGWFILTRRFGFMLMLCIIFDSRDIAIDKIRGLRSLATELTPRTLRWLIFIIFIILFGTNFTFPYFGMGIRPVMALQVSTVALLLVYFLSTKKQGYFFYYFFVDGLMLFSALVTYIAGK